MGVGAVPVTEILGYARALCVNDLEEFLEIMQAMDNAYLSDYNEKQAQTNNSTRTTK